jgi:hypothetical protein
MIGRHMKEFATMDHDTTLYVRVQMDDPGKARPRSDAILFISILLDHRTPDYFDPETDVQAFGESIAKAYVALLLERYPHLKHFIILWFAKDRRSPAPRYSDAIGYLSADDIAPEDLDEHRRLAAEAGFGTSFSAPFHFREREYRRDTLESEP